MPVPASSVPPLGRHLSADRVLAIARALPRMRALRRANPGSYDGAYLKGATRWQVSFFSRKGAKEIGQVIVADETGRVLEQWTGFQVAWSMARGYPGAFGRHVNALYIWLPLCLLFAVPFVNPRRLFSLLHLDLLVLVSFSISLAFFNHGEIYKSVPLAYPPLIYLFGRMLWMTRRRARPGPPLKLLVPVPWLVLGVMFLLGFRIALNVIDSNVIDVGYAGVIGAHKIVDDRPLYGSWPADNEHGDTYGPVTYESYVPFQQVFGWSGNWDDLPAAHAAAIVFDLLALGLMFLLGWRIRGPTLGVALAYAWVSYPFTLFVLESNSNDTLVAVFLLGALLFASSPPVRGAFAALAGLAKLAPLALAPVLATHGLRGLTPLRRARALGLFGLTFALVGALASIPALDHDSLHRIFERTIVYQANRGSPFSVWGLYGGHAALHGLETAVQIGAVVLAVVLALAPRREDVVGLAGACGAILLALQLGVEHWFYLYIPWFFPLVMVALLGAAALAGPAPRAPAEGAPAEGAPTEPAPARAGEPDGASAPARSHPLVAAWSSSG
ncbi:MAG TPA: hypothetical protein VMG62_07225 [Solirubrobacteraceae bacterium]|nr:hypothetical protein [Solirubrobacteraceae bacterium]